MAGRPDVPVEKEHSDPFSCYHTGQKENGGRWGIIKRQNGICDKRYQRSPCALDPV